MGIMDGLTNRLPGANVGSPDTPLKDHFNSEKGEFPDEVLWEYTATDWYKVYGYQFVVYAKTEPKPESKNNSSIFEKVVGALLSSSGIQLEPKVYFTLPIPPSSFIVKPVFPSRATATLGGVVEETSPVKFWFISMEGTTGTAISRDPKDIRTRKGIATAFRSVIASTGLLDGLMSSVNKGISKIGGIADRIAGAVSGGDAQSVAFNIMGAINDALTPPLPYSTSAVPMETNGFVEAQELQKFLYMYQMLKSKKPDKYDLYFIHQQTGQKWRVIVKDFSLHKNAQNPNLWRYKINLQGWDVSPLNGEAKEEFDRFGPHGDLKQVNSVDLYRLPEIMGRASAKLNKRI